MEGLWASLPALAIYAVLGSSLSLSMGPEATTALMTAIAIKPLADGDPVRYAELAAALAVLVGLMSIAAWLLRLGVAADLLSRPILVGYMAGVALIMIADQLSRVTGVPVAGPAFFSQLDSFARGAGRIQLATLTLAAAVLAFLLLLVWRRPHAPGLLLAVLLATGTVAASGPSHHGIGVVGPVPAGVPVPGLPGLGVHDLQELALPAALLGVLAFNILDGVLVAIALSVADLLVRVARPHDAVQGLVPGLAGMHDVDDYPEARTIPRLVVYRYDAPLCFANAGDFRRRALAAADQQSPVRWFVLNVEANVEVDFTALEAMDAVRREIISRGGEFVLARVKQDLLARLQSFRLADTIGAERMFPTLPTAVAAYQSWAAAQDYGVGSA